MLLNLIGKKTVSFVLEKEIQIPHDLKKYNPFINNNNLLVNYDKNYVPHSPLFIIYHSISKKIFYSEELFRLFNLHTFLLIPLFVGLSLKAKFNFERNDIRYLLPSIFLLSPYFRAGSIWTDDNVFALIFFSIDLLIIGAGE